MPALSRDTSPDTIRSVFARSGSPIPHFGTIGCPASASDFLRATESDTLYLVGDIIKGWSLRRRWYWDQTHNNVVQAALKKARRLPIRIFGPQNVSNRLVAINQAANDVTRSLSCLT